jgi:hypothetical protein
VYGTLMIKPLFRIDGCKTGRFAAGDPNHEVAKDVTRFNYDSKYVQGLNDGFAACKAIAQGSGK